MTRESLEAAIRLARRNGWLGRLEENQRKLDALKEKETDNYYKSLSKPYDQDTHSPHGRGR